MKTTTQTIVGRIAQVGLLACFASTCLFVSNSSAQNFPFDYKVEESSSENSGKQDVDVAQQEQDKRQDAPAGTLRLKKHTFHDPGVDNMASHTVLMPEGWTASGGAWWIDPQYLGMGPSHHIKVTSPQNVEVELTPAILFANTIHNKEFWLQQIPPGTDDFGLELMMRSLQSPTPGSVHVGVIASPMPQGGPEGWRQRLIQQGIPGTTNLQVREVKVVPEMQPLMDKELRAHHQPFIDLYRNDPSISAQSGGAYYAIHITFDRDGRRWEQLSLAGVHHFTSTTKMDQSTVWGVTPGRVYTVPEGELAQHLPTLVTVADSLAETAEWQEMKFDLAAKKAEHNAKIAEQNAQTARDLAKIHSQGQAEIRRTNRQAWEKIQQTRNETNEIISNTYDPSSGDAVQQKYINSIYEVEDYDDPTTGSTVQLPTGSQRAFSDGNGGYLLTDDPLLDPNTLGAGTFTEIHARQ